MDPVERFRMLRADDRWTSTEHRFTPTPRLAAADAPRRWWAWAVPAMVVAAALAALAAFTLGGALTLGTSSGPAAPGTTDAPDGATCTAGQLHAVLGAFPEGMIADTPRYDAGGSELRAFVISVANTGPSCVLPGSPTTTWTETGGAAPVTAEASRQESAVAVPDGGVVFAALTAPFVPKCPPPLGGAGASDGQLAFAVGKGGQELRLTVGPLGGCPLAGTPTAAPFRAALSDVLAGLKAAGWSIGSAEPPGTTADDVQGYLADLARQQAAFATLRPCALDDLAASIDDAMSGSDRVVIELRNHGANDCTLVGSPTVHYAAPEVDIDPAAQLAQPADTSLLKVEKGGVAYVTVERSKPRHGTASCAPSTGGSGGPSGGYSISLPDRPGRIFVDAGIDAQCERDRGVGLSVEPFLRAATGP